MRFFPSQMTEHRVYRNINDSLKVVNISTQSISPQPFFLKRMNKSHTSYLLFASLTGMLVNSVIAETNPTHFRGESPSNRLVPEISTPAETVIFRDNTDMEVRSAVALASAGLSNSEFVATANPGSGNFQKRPYRFTFTLNQGYDDNIYTSSFDQQSSFFTSASLGASLTLGDGQTSLQAAFSAGGSYYWDRDDTFDPDISLNVDFSHVFSPKLRLDITTYLAYQAEPDFQIGFGQNRRSGNYIYGSVGFSLAQTFSRRLSAVYGYTVSGVYYDEATIADISNRMEQIFSIQLRYLIQPTISLVGEYRFGLITYDTANRDSSSNYLLGGVDFTLNRRLTASFRAGAQLRDSDDLGEETSPFVESTLSYKYGERSSIQWVNRYGFEESDFGFGSTRKTYRTGITVNQKISSRINANGGVFFTTSEYEGTIADSEQTLDLNLGVVYSVNRLLSLQAGYTYTTVFSDNTFREYDRNRVYMGATLSF